jgi:hypothetical protein
MGAAVVIMDLSDFMIGLHEADRGEQSRRKLVLQ